MKFWKLAKVLLAVILVFLVVQCVMVWRALSCISDLMSREQPDLAAVREKWDRLYGYLEFSVPEDSLAAIEDDLSFLENSSPEEKEYELARLRVSRHLKRLYDNFVPSFSGVF